MSAVSTLRGIKSVLTSNLFITLPLPSTFAPSSLPSQTFIITGANSGLGFESGLHPSHLNAGRIILTVRDLSKGDDARKALLKQDPTRSEASIDVWLLDMASHASIQAFAARAASLPRLDGVLANAGLMTSKLSFSEGNETTIDVNVINTFFLYLLLLPTLRASSLGTGHVPHFSIPNSALHYTAPVAEISDENEDIFDRLNDPKKADMAGRYPLSKLLVLYGVREFAARTNAKQSPIKGTSVGNCIINTPNPSFCKSNLAREMQGSRGYRAFEKMVARSSEEGSRTLVHGLIGAGVESDGQYLSNCVVEVPAGHVTNEWGKRFQIRFFDQLIKKLEAIQPGISKNL